ncbi:MAG: histidine kinase, partial [Eubacteriales bacterium]
ATDDYMALYNDTHSYLQTQFAYNEAFAAAILVYWARQDTPIFVSGYGLEDRSRTYRDFLENNQDYFMDEAANIGTTMTVVEYSGVRYLVRNLVDSSFQEYATLVLPLRWNYLEESGANIVWVTDVSLTIGNVVIPVLGEQAPLETYELTHHAEDFSFTMGVESTIDRLPFRLEATVEDDFLRQARLGFYGVVFITILVSGILFGVIVFSFYHNVSKPVGKLLRATDHLERGDLGYQIEMEPKNKEFYQLTNRFNAVSHKLVELFERNTMEQQALHDAQIKALQSQINPHFLNNTLELINWQARMSGEEKISQMIESLSVMLNAAMARDGTATVTMREEYSYIEAYLFIISQRFGARLKVDQSIEEEAWSAMVPRLILQPIVENAIEHGVARRTSGEIHLRIFVQNGMLYIDVSHDGAISPADRQAIDQLLSWDGQENMETGSARIGIRNVHLRLKILCGADSGLKIWEREEGVVSSCIRLPFNPAP